MAGWRSYSTEIQWGPVAPAIREPIDAFLLCVLGRIARLGVALDGARDVDVLAALAARLLELEPTSTVDASLVAEHLSAVIDEVSAMADAAQAGVWRTVVTDLLEGDDPAVQWASCAILAERVLRATIASRPALDPDGVLLAAATVLEGEMRWALMDVLSHAIPQAAYRLM